MSKKVILIKQQNAKDTRHEIIRNDGLVDLLLIADLDTYNDSIMIKIFTLINYLNNLKKWYLIWDLDPTYIAFFCEPYYMFLCNDYNLIKFISFLVIKEEAEIDRLLGIMNKYYCCYETFNPWVYNEYFKQLANNRNIIISIFWFYSERDDITNSITNFSKFNLENSSIVTNERFQSIKAELRNYRYTIEKAINRLNKVIETNIGWNGKYDLIPIENNVTLKNIEHFDDSISQRSNLKLDKNKS